MASSTNLGTTAVNYGSGVAWGSPPAVLLNNGNSTSVALVGDGTGNQNGQFSTQILVTGFGYTIPAGSVINGIEFTANIQDNSGSIYDYQSPILFKNSAGTSTPVGTSKPISGTAWNQNAFVTRTYGSPTDLWGTTWTAAQINDALFGVGYAGQNRIVTSATVTAFTQYWRMTVYWTPNVSLTSAGSDSTSVSDSGARVSIRTRTAPTTLTTSDATTRFASISKSSSETTSVSDASSRTSFSPRSLNDSATITDLATRLSTTSRNQSDSTSVSDTNTRTTSDSRSIAESTSTSDSSVRTGSNLRPASDSINISDIPSVNRFRNSSDSTSTSDSSSKNTSTSRSSVDLNSLSDLVSRSGLFPRSLSEATIAISDQSIRGSVNLARGAPETVVVNDLTSKILTTARAASDSTTVNDSSIRIRSFIGLSNELVTISDSANKGVTNLVKSGLDNAVVTDSIPRSVSNSRTSYDFVIQIDRAERIYYGFAVESLNVSDALTRGTRSIKSGADSYAAGDSLACITSVRLGSADLMTINESAVRYKVYFSSINENISVSDTAIIQSISLNNVGFENVNLSDSTNRVNSASRSSSDSVTLGDLASRTFNRFANESIGIFDSSRRSISLIKSKTEFITVFDFATKSQSRTSSASDSISIADLSTPIRYYPRSASESISISDLVTRAPIGFIRISSDNASISDFSSRIRDRFRSANDSETISDSATRLSNSLKTIADSITVADLSIRTVSLFRAGTDAVNLSDVVKTRVNRSSSDSVIISDLTNKSVSLFKTSSDSIGISDISSITQRRVIGIAIDSVAVTDGKSLPRSGVDSVTITDLSTTTRSSSRQANDYIVGSSAMYSVGLTLGDAYFGQAPLGGTMGVPPPIDVATATSSLVRFVTDNITISDGSSGIKVKVRSSSDTVTQSDAVARGVGKTGIASEPAFSISDISTGNYTRGRNALEVVPDYDSVSSFAINPRNPSDTVVVSATVTDLPGRPRTTSDSVSMSDSALLQRFLFSVESLTINDTASRDLRAIIRNSIDVLSLSDISIRNRVRFRDAADTVALSESATRTQTVVRSVAESSLAVSDNTTGAKSRLASDNVSISDLAIRLRAVTRAINETITLSDISTNSQSYTRSVATILTISDSSIRSIPLTRALSDSLFVSDNLSGSTINTRLFSETLNISDLSLRTASSFRIVTESIIVSDTSSRTRARNRITNDFINTFDIASENDSVSRFVIETITLSDLATRSLTSPHNPNDLIIIADIGYGIYQPFDKATYNITIITLPKVLSYPKMVVTSSDGLTEITERDQTLHVYGGPSILSVNQPAPIITVTVP
jgi:hypothetical protein